ncbi:MAG: 2-oxo acid dehydrogenase subunit E2 [Chloroherpetonaceae bacterium]|nr:2-oxo acid dehydrogenase subunit E2 [Chloroherpetonaceae bacterium]MDW8437547.1 dihydrolipoamide acetyltransferase family protein [Chloroherpetonaceae bacterium]
MAKVDVVMPKMGESIMEGTILKWLKKVGDTVAKDENILSIATDKVDAEVPANEAGILAEILFEEGAVVAVGTTIARIETDVSAAVSTSTPSPSPAKADEATAQPVANPSAPTTNGATMVEPQTSPRHYTPVVLKIAQEEGVTMSELASIRGTGLDGRVTKADLLNYIQNRRKQSAASMATVAPSAKVEVAPVSAPPSAPAPKPAAPAHHPVVYDAARSEVVPMDNMRKLIAEHMVRSKQTSAHVTSVAEADVTGLVNLVKKRKNAFEATNGVKLTYTPFFIDATIKALKQFPMLNASVDGDKIIIKKYINFGVAVALGERGEGGLIVPVIKNADEMSLVGLARAVQDLASRARSKKLSPDDIQGGTFTLTNYGTSGNLFGAPIINQPQVAILGTGAVVKRPVVKTLDDGSDVITIRSMMYLSLSYDHRIIDGALAGFFLQTLCKNLESYDENFTL